MSKLMVCPALILMSIKFVRSICGAILRGLVTIVLVGSLASPGPAAFIAFTWNT